MKRALTIVTGILLTVTCMAQTRVVYGNLTVFKSFPVQNVEVTSKKAKATTVSDSLGNFALVCLEKDVVQIRPQAFQAVNKKVNADTDTVKVNLIFVDSKKNREIAVGYGYISEDNLNFAVNNLTNENNDFCSYSNVFELIRGQLSGVTVSNNAVYIRGGNTSFTSGASEALYVVDGQTTQSIEGIPPCDISSIDLLKGSEAAIYGSRGGNGVVLIRTRKE